MKKYSYIGNCTHLDGVGDMIDNAKSITYRTFQKYIFMDEIREIFSDYFRKNSPIKLYSDWAVSFYSSKYKGHKCVYLVHSGIEYVFAE